MSCLFCKMVSGDLPVKKLAESETAIAIADIHPQAPQHFLMIPKVHVGSLNDLTPDQRKNLIPELYNLADQVARLHGFRDEGYRCVINNQSLAGQSVFHLHLHVLGGGPLRGSFGA